MTDKEKIVAGLVHLQENDRDGYFAIVAIFHALMGAESLAMPEGCSRGVFKRAIRRIRAVKAGIEKVHPDCIPCLETAAAMIRRDWLHRKEDQ